MVYSVTCSLHKISPRDRSSRSKILYFNIKKFNVFFTEKEKDYLVWGRERLVKKYFSNPWTSSVFVISAKSKKMNQFQKVMSFLLLNWFNSTGHQNLPTQWRRSFWGAERVYTYLDWFKSYDTKRKYFPYRVFSIL